MLCPICNHTVSRGTSNWFPLFIVKEQKCQRCGTQWVPAYSKPSIVVFVVLCLAFGIGVFIIDDSVYVHGNLSAVSSDDKPIAQGLYLLSLAAVCWGLVNPWLLLWSPGEITHRGVWPATPDGLDPKVETTTGQTPNVKSNEGRGADE